MYQLSDSLVGSRRSGGPPRLLASRESYIPYQCMDSYLSSTGLGSASMGKIRMEHPNNASSQTKNYEITFAFWGDGGIVPFEPFFLDSEIKKWEQVDESGSEKGNDSFLKPAFLRPKSGRKGKPSVPGSPMHLRMDSLKVRRGSNEERLTVVDTLGTQKMRKGVVIDEMLRGGENKHRSEIPE
ncbi:hypothetical protein HAX54_034011 [Datura stramonium]|uniref:Uncharacterized protein n=1 Tax=Datura stramonium TaxID=4076 RepID=A0ABS8VFW3_DATST|nr:hypothetical protein [Datura stramonium]